MGEVYHAKDSKLNREVALKVLPEHLARDPERIGRFPSTPLRDRRLGFGQNNFPVL